MLPHILDRKPGNEMRTDSKRENRTLFTPTGDLLKIAEKKMERGKREKALLETLRSTESDENAWKTTIEAPMQTVQAAVNRK